MPLLNDIASHWLDGTVRMFEAVSRGYGSPATDPEPVTRYREVYRAGKVALRRYTPEVRMHRTPVVIVYALIKRPYILDLQPDKSVVRALLNQGFEVYLIDWLPPTKADTELGFEEYVGVELANAVHAVQQSEDVDQVHLIGYCFGALLALLYTATHPEAVRNLVTLTIPFDMGVREIGIYHLVDSMSELAVDLVTKVYGNCPAWMVNANFLSMAPVHHGLDKYVGLYRNAQRDGYAEMFELFERWMMSDVPIAGRLFRQLVIDLFKRNALARGEFRLGGQKVDLRRVSCPLLNVVAEHDDVVHPRSSLGLLEHVGSTDKANVTFPVGHLGAVVSGGAMRKLWPQIGAWLAARDFFEN
ncbi:MAG TPA: alpha/beta fold hydrolase [Candidatus Binataceae bacterium]|jgi:polyhydroxyalkanoate synthase|nr:alpha/beta fold hydrolase [Candidatus Binataceae bacterium]